MLVDDTQNNTVITSYAGGYIYEETQGYEFLEMLPHPEGYIAPIYGDRPIDENTGATLPLFSNGYQYAYNYTDHLGNIRLTYADSDGDGEIQASTEIISEKHYYPFGLVQKGYNDGVSGNVNHTANKFSYLGQEEQNDLGLNWVSYKWRNADQALGRFLGPDLIAENYPNQTNYQFASNNPVWKIEIEGLEGHVPTGADFINGLGYGIDNGDGTAKQAGSGGILSKGFFSDAVGLGVSVLSAGHDILSSGIESGIEYFTGTTSANNTLTDSEFNSSISSGDENAFFAGLETEAAAAYNEAPSIAGEAGAIITTIAASEALLGAGTKSKPSTTSASNEVPSIIYRGGRSNASAATDLKLRPGESTVSFRAHNSNPIGYEPVLRRGKPFIAVETAKLPKGSVTVDGGLPGIPPGHVSVNATPEQIVKAINHQFSGKFPKN